MEARKARIEKKTVHEKGKVGESKEGKEGRDWKLILNHRQGEWKHSHLIDGVWMDGTNIKTSALQIGIDETSTP